MGTFRLQVIYSGGTIGMQESARGLVSGSDLPDWLQQLCREYFSPRQLELSIKTYYPLIDSSNAQPQDWQRLIDDLLQLPTDCDGALILHGTDTMAYTASALAFATVQRRVPIVITGSQLPFNVTGSDATDNVLGAIKTLLAAPYPLLGLFFANSLWPATAVSKTNAVEFSAFTAPNGQPLATVDESGQIKFTQSSRQDAYHWLKNLSCIKPYSHDKEVSVLFLTPGIREQRLQQLLEPAPDGLLILGYGAGNGPENDPNLPALVQQLTNKGTITLILSQCRAGKLNSEIYSTGGGLLAAGAICGGTLTVETAYTKLLFLLSQNLTNSEIRDLLGISLIGEMD